MKTIRTFSAFLGVILFTTPFVEAQTEQPQTIKVGFIGAFSGPAKTFGEAGKNGFEMGLESVGNMGVTVIYEDDQLTPAKTVAAFKKLTEVDGVNVVISVGSSPSNAVAPLAEKQKIPLIAWASDASVSLKRNFVVRSWMSGEQEGKCIAEEAKRRGYHHFGFVRSVDDYAASVQQGVQKNVPAEDLVLDEEYPADVSDYKSFLLKVKQKKVTELGLCLKPGQSSLIAKQSRELGMALKFFGCEYLNSASEVANAGGTLLGAWFATGPVSPSFREHYVAHFHNDDVISGAAIHYDIARLLARMKLTTISGQIIMDKLGQAADDFAAVGNYRVVKTENDRFFEFPLLIREVTEQGFHDISESK